MTTLTRIIIVSIISFILASCNVSMDFGNGINGSGNVTHKDRDISKDFDAIKVSQGLDLYITQSNAVSLAVEADDNLHNLIKTEVVDGVLNIYSKENIRRAVSKKIMLHITNISSIKATSGSDVYATNTLNLVNLELNSTSGADIKLDVITETLNCISTSGSDIELSGSTKILTASATSGSDINASNLMAETSNAKATSGADISLNTSKILSAKATIGGDIRYLGNPEKVEVSDTSAGRVRPQ